MQTREDRMRRHYKALKRRGNPRAWMVLARVWKVSIRQAKKIVRAPMKDDWMATASCAAHPQNLYYECTERHGHDPEQEGWD